MEEKAESKPELKTVYPENLFQLNALLSDAYLINRQSITNNNLCVYFVDHKLLCYSKACIHLTKARKISEN